MKNLKRVLSLALSGIMLVGMMAMGASAVDYKDFTDKDEIQHTEAVSTMNLLGVIAGKDTGAFDPTGTVTRAEMAKMITIALNGGKDPVLGTKTVPTYTDIKGHWAEKYIEYCSSLNIIAGQGDGTFAPNATVTGSQAAKMMLTALGYEAEVYNLVGADWEINTSREANNAGLFDELDDILPAEGMSRDNAAQLIYNGIQAKTLTKTPSQSVTTGEITFRYDLNGTPLLASRFKVYTTYGTLDYIEEDKLGVEINHDYDNKMTYKGNSVDSAEDDFTKVATDYTQYYGYTVKVLYKASDEVVGIAEADANNAYFTAMSAISKDGDKVKFAGKSYTLEKDKDNKNKVAVIKDGVPVAEMTATDFVNPQSYDEVTFVDNDNDGKIEYAVITTVTPAKVSFASSSEIMAGGETYKTAEHDIDEGIAKNDYVAIRTNKFVNGKTITKVEAIEASVDGYRTKSDPARHEYKLDGTWYVSPTTDPVDSITGAGKTMKIFAINGVIYNGEAAEAASMDKLVMILDYDQGTITRQVKILKADGTKATVKLDKFVNAAGEKLTSDPAKGSMFTYSETDDGYKFTVAKTIGDYTWAASGNVAIADKAAKIGTKAVSDDAVIFVFDGTNDGKVITGKQLGKQTVGTTASSAEIVEASLGFFSSEVGGLDRVTYAAVKANGKLPGATDDANLYGVVVSNAYVDSEDYITYDVWTGSETVTVREKDTSVLANRVVGKVLQYSAIDSSNVIKDAALVANLTAGAIQGKIGDEISFNGSDMVKLTKDTNYLYVDSSASGKDIGKSAVDVVRADKREDAYVENVLYVLDEDEVTLLVVDVKNELSAKFGATKADVTLTKGAQTKTTVTFTDKDGVTVTGKDMKVGDYVTVTVKCKVEAGATATVTLTGAKTVGGDTSYTSGGSITLAENETWTRTFVITSLSGTPSIVVAES